MGERDKVGGTEAMWLCGGRTRFAVIEARRQLSGVDGRGWRAEGDANDNVGNNDGTLVNGATFAAGEVGQAFSLDGVDDYVEIADSVSLSVSTALSVEAWINPTSVAAGEILTKYNSSVSQV